jgi:hypothetical protein
VQFTHDDFFQQGDLAVEEVADAGEDDDRQILRPRPGERRGERDDVVALAVDDERVGGDEGTACFSVDGPMRTIRRGGSPAPSRCEASTAT